MHLNGIHGTNILSLNFNPFNATFFFFFKDLVFMELIKIDGYKHFISLKKPSADKIHENLFIIEIDVFHRHPDEFTC